MEIDEKVIYELDAKELKVYLIMLDKFNKNNQQPFQYNTKDISNDIQSNRNYIRSILKRLLELNYITIDKVGKNNYYSINNNMEEIKKIDMSSNKIGIDNISENDKDFILDQMIYIYSISDRNEKKSEYNDLILKLEKYDSKDNIKEYLKNIYKYVKDNYEPDGTLKEIAVQIDEAKNKVSTVLSKNNLLYDISGDIEAYRKTHKECSNMTDIEIAEKIANGNKNYAEFENDINEMFFSNSTTEIFKDDNDELILRITPSNDNVNEYSFEKSILSFLDMSDAVKSKIDNLSKLQSQLVEYLNKRLNNDYIIS